MSINVADEVSAFGGTAGIAKSPPMRNPLLAYVSIARPDHWFKNVFMLAGIALAAFYHSSILGWGTLGNIALAVVATCLVASSNYVINEILDSPTDKAHPVKRHRPIPSGQVHLGLAYVEWIALGIVGLALASLVNWPFFLVAAWLLVMGIIYNVPPIRSKEHAYIDVLSEAVNNPIRLLLGWFAVTPTEIPPVSLLIAYWMIGAFFMATKRFSEYRSIGDPAAAAAYRSSFRYYTEERLLVSMFFYTTCFALFFGIFIVRYRLELILMIPLISGFMTYYLAIAFKKESAAQAPEKLYREKWLMVYLTFAVLMFLALMFVRVPVLYDWFNVAPPSELPPLWEIG